jgi:3-hydroxyisobutyrate dehydrogenase-like beta-hydroxyacid dehydrogenase
MTGGSCRVALIGLGEVGQVLASDLHRIASVELSAWDRLFPAAGSAPQRSAAALSSFLTAATDMRAAVRERALVISAVTAGECRAAAEEAAAAIGAGAFYLDLNSVSPRTRAEAARAIAGAGARYVEAAVMSPIAPQRLAAPIWLGGPHAREFLPIAQSLGFAGSAVYSDTLGAASAAKMCRSVIVKGLEALLTESLLTARRHGVENVVIGSLQDLFPAGDWRKLARYMIARSLQHGRRRAEEMREAARTVAEAGFAPWMCEGIVERQEWAAGQAAALRAEGLTDMLDDMLSRVPPAAAGHEAVEPGGEAASR